MPSILTAVKIARIFNEPVENVFIFEEEIYESKTLSSIMYLWHYWWFVVLPWEVLVLFYQMLILTYPFWLITCIIASLIIIGLTFYLWKVQKMRLNLKIKVSILLKMMMLIYSKRNPT